MSHLRVASALVHDQVKRLQQTVRQQQLLDLHRDTSTIEVAVRLDIRDCGWDGDVEAVEDQRASHSEWQHLQVTHLAKKRRLAQQDVLQP
jgi:hypothetical protein